CRWSGSMLIPGSWCGTRSFRTFSVGSQSQGTPFPRAERFCLWRWAAPRVRGSGGCWTLPRVSSCRGVLFRRVRSGAGLRSWGMGFDGAQRENVEVAARSGERYLHPGVVSDQGVLRLDYVPEPDWARGEVGAEFLSWDGGEATVVPVDLSPNESLLVDIEGST